MKRYTISYTKQLKSAYVRLKKLKWMERLPKQCKILVIPKLRYSFDTILMKYQWFLMFWRITRHVHTRYVTCVF